jgi:hypothetical protein
MNKYLKFEYWNTCDLGNIYYQGGQHFWFFLDGDVLEPFHEEVEDGQENGDGDFIPTFRRGMKRYRIRTGLVPDYMVDAIQRMKLHDHIELTFKTGEIEQIYNVDVEMEWVFEKMCHQATVVLTFDMDEKIVVGACCDNLPIGEEEPEPEPIPDIYWIAANGDDNSGSGTYTSPWKTLAYAATQATVPGDIIHVRAGTYYETVQTVLAPGVSILGAGPTSIIKSSVAGAIAPWGFGPTIALESAVEGTNGNQSISYLYFDGDSYTADGAISIYRRSNVSIHHCTFSEWHYFAARFRGGAAPPTTYATGNSFHHNTAYDCGGPNVSYGSLQIGGQTGMLVYNNDIQQPSRAGVNQEGFPIKYCAGGNNRGLKIYDNILKCNYTGGDDHWHFSIELFASEGGIEIYGNTCVGTIDFSNYLGSQGVNDDAGYGFAVKIHDNTLGCDALTDFETYGITFERSLTGGTYIYNNNIRNVQTGITFSNPQDGGDWEDVYVYYNLIYNIGQTDGAYGGGILLGRLSDVYVLAINNWNFLNNVIADTSAGQATYGIRVRGGTSIAYNNLTIRNNIITAISQGDGSPIHLDHVNADIVSVENNCFYDNGTDAVTKATCVITNETNQNNITTDPTFVGATNFHLQAGSGCINTGIATGLAFITTDYDGDAIADPPEIGAYEF